MATHAAQRGPVKPANQSAKILGVFGAPLRSARVNAILIALGMGFFSLSLASCGTVRAVATSLKIIEHADTSYPREAPSSYIKAVALLNEQKFEQAYASLNAFLNDEPTSPWTQAANLNVGRSLEGLGRWTDAIERFRGVIRATPSAPKLQAMALYRLSFCQEALGEDQETVAALSDLQTRLDSLPPEIARAEMPARLAAAYARVGNFELALANYKTAEAGIARLRREHESKSVPTWLPQTLYYMGHLSLRSVTWQEFETAVRPLTRGQVYLLQAAELPTEPNKESRDEAKHDAPSESWADRAANELIGRYAELWRVIETAPVPQLSDPLVGRRELQDMQWDRTLILRESLEQLKARMRPPGGSESAHLPPSAAEMRITSFIVELEKKMDELLSERKAGEGLTPESQQRQQRLRGRVLLPDDRLEKAYRQRNHSKLSPEHRHLPSKKVQGGKASVQPTKEPTTKTTPVPPAIPSEAPAGTPIEPSDSQQPRQGDPNL